jgi:hypothetical protein
VRDAARFHHGHEKPQIRYVEAHELSPSSFSLIPRTIKPTGNPKDTFANSALSPNVALWTTAPQTQ